MRWLLLAPRRSLEERQEAAAPQPAAELEAAE
jgi:hypothetical protein